MNVQKNAPVNAHFVITISRLCGAGGTSIARILSEKLGVPVYGRELLRMASDMSGIHEELFAKADERIRNGLLFKISKEVYDGTAPSQSADFTADHDLFDYQAKVLRKLAEKESYIVIGRCADYVLRDLTNVVRVFVTANESDCLDHLIQRDRITRKEAGDRMQRLNNERASYYRYYTDQTWSNAGNYDLSISTSHISYEECADIIIAYMERKCRSDKASHDKS